MLLLALPAAVFACVLLYARSEQRPTLASGPGSVVWGDGGVIFANTNEMAGWLRAHGTDFQTFKKNHPAAVALVRRRTTTSPDTKAAAAKQSAPKTVKVASAATTATATSTSSRLGLFALAGGAMLLLAFAFAPAPLLERWHIVHSENAGDLRLVVVAAAVAIGAGLGVTLLL